MYVCIDALDWMLWIRYYTYTYRYDPDTHTYSFV